LGQACAALREFREAMDAAKVDEYRATATSAVREASNGATLIERARREAGVELEVIEGVEEARLIRLAVVRKLGLEDKRAILVDVGGGSTEVTYLDRGQSTFSMSLPLGTVRLLETYLRGVQKLDRERVRLLSESVERAFAEIVPHVRKLSVDTLIVTGGNSETLCDLCPSASSPAHGARALATSSLEALMQELAGMTVDERRVAYNLRPDRADTILPAAHIYARAARLFKVDTLVAPAVGLKEGILEELIAKYFNVWDTQGEEEGVLSACNRLGQRYKYDEAHGRLVSKLAAILFDTLRPLHGLSPRDRLLLRAAAILHDVGDFVRYDGHHKHSYYLIAHSDIMGLSPEERSIVANVARYHRKSAPDPSHPNFRELDKDSRAKVRALSAILRIADALDREHQGKVHGVTASIDNSRRRLVLNIDGQEDRELEEWTVRAKSELLHDVFDLEVHIAGAVASQRPQPPDPPPASQRLRAAKN
jgi:exopolyphosphatase/guanosine-5'-triphosphate,3'-diphosphate pyrophosphatase